MSIKLLNELERLNRLKEIGDDPNRIRLFGMLYPRHNEKSANALTKAVIRWIELHGGQAERINTMGRYVPGKTVNKGFYGATQLKGRYIPTTSTKGSADISATINGRSVKIEIKYGKDRQSEAQKKYQASVEASGGLYWLVRSFDEFVRMLEGVR